MAPQDKTPDFYTIPQRNPQICHSYVESAPPCRIPSIPETSSTVLWDESSAGKKVVEQIMGS